MPEESLRLLDVIDLEKRFAIRRGFFGRATADVRAVDHVSFFIRKGETFGLVGESGSGKTTTGRAILRAIEPTSGQVLFHLGEGPATDVTALNKHDLRAFRRHMQMIFQDPYSSLNPRMTVRDIIAEPVVVSSILKGSSVNERVSEVAQRCRLNITHLRRFPHAFSGGERQRIGIARALVLNPEFIVCDEAVSALDVSIQAEILNLLKELQQELGLTYLFIAHDLSVVEHISDRVAVMYFGRLVEMATTEDLFRKPMHPYTEALMSSIPIADPEEIMRPVPLSGEIPNPLAPPSGCHFHPRCRYAQDTCKSTAPTWREVSPEHFVACHFAEQLTLMGALSG